MKRNVMNDQEIIALYWAKEERAISATAEKYGNYCHIIAYNILYDYFDAEECVNDTYLRAWNSIPPQRPNRLDAFLGKITRNLALNRYKRNHAAKRGGGQVEIALSELENCIPNVKGVEQVAEEAWLVSVINRFFVRSGKNETQYLCSQILVPVFDTGYCGYVRRKRKQNKVVIVSYAQRT